MPEQLLTNRSEYLEMPLFDLTERLFAELKLGEIKDMIKQTAYKIGRASCRERV